MTEKLRIHNYEIRKHTFYLNRVLTMLLVSFREKILDFGKHCIDKKLIFIYAISKMGEND